MTRTRSSGCTIRFEGDRVIKRQSSTRTRVELARTRHATEVAERTGLFCVPEVLSSDVETGEIEFRRVSVTGLRLLFTDPGHSAAAARAGHALAAIHGSQPDLEDGSVSWHGDYGLTNLAETDDRGLVVFDWSNAAWTDEAPERSAGPASLDLGIFLISLFLRRPFGPHPVPGIPALGQAFLEAYAEGSGGGFDPEALRAEFPRLSRLWRRYWRARLGTLRAASYASSLRELGRFVEEWPH